MLQANSSRSSLDGKRRADLWCFEWSWARENDIIRTSNMSGEMHMQRRRDAGIRYSAAYPTGAERIEKGEGKGEG